MRDGLEKEESGRTRQAVSSTVDRRVVCGQDSVWTSGLWNFFLVWAVETTGPEAHRVFRTELRGSQ